VGGAVVQSGLVTPGHAVTWATDGVVQDGGLISAIAPRVIAYQLSMDFNNTGDQAIIIPAAIAAFALTGIIVTNPSISLTTAAGGFYPQILKGGTPIVANTQVYSSLTGATKLLNATVAAGALATRFSPAVLINSYAVWLSLTTAQGAVAFADVFLVGVILPPS
jgi:hypothetical protein